MWFEVLNRVIRTGFTEVVFEQGLERGKGISPVTVLGKSVPGRKNSQGKEHSKIVIVTGAEWTRRGMIADEDITAVWGRVVHSFVDPYKHFVEPL